MPAPKGNQYAVGNKGGRPPLYDKPKKLTDRVNAYFLYIQGDCHKEKKQVYYEKAGEFREEEIIVWDRHPEPATITGLTLFLGFSDRGSLSYLEEKEEFSHIIKRARARVEYEYEKKLSGTAVTGSIFALKNMGWKDVTEAKNTNYNYNSADLSKEDIKNISDALNSEI